LRALDRSDAVAISGTDDATYPVFSPDGASVAFWADGWIKRVAVAGGTATTIAPAQAPREGRSRTELDIDGVSFNTRVRTPVRTSGFPVQILDTGHLVYAAVNGDTFAAPFDVSRMAVTGSSMPLPERPGTVTPAAGPRARRPRRPGSR
jgi:hypothetical protein